MQNANTLLEDISAEIGYTATSAICGWYGGRRLRIPIQANSDHQIAKLIGQAAFVRMVAAFGDQLLFIPKDSAQKRMRRNRIVFDLIRKGTDVGCIANRAHVSKWHVTNIRRALEDAGLLPMILRAPPESDDAN